MATTSLIDIVDENDKVIGTKTIQQVREGGHIHRIARIMVEDSKGRILLQKRTAKLLWPNCWDNSAAGHVDAGEDYFTAAKRELYEEIGLKPESLEEIDKYSTDVLLDGYRLRRFNMLYKCVSEQTPTKLQASEVSEVRWFTKEDIQELIEMHPEQVTDGLKDVFNKYYLK